MSDITNLIDDHLSAYGETDAGRRRRLLEQSWDPQGTLADPPMAATGHDEIEALFAAVQAQFPGHAFCRTSVVDEHHAVARYTWDLVAPDGTVPVAGTDIAHVGPEGTLRHVVGFFGALQPRA